MPEVVSKSQVETAREAFLHRLRAIEGVQKIEAGLETIRVTVPDQNGAAADAVYALEAEVRRFHPYSAFDVWVSQAAPES